MLRIVAGELGGRRLKAPAGQATRPTADRVRQALFNILGPPPPHARVLDLYAGTGALGIEALSRGAQEAVFVEQDPSVCHLIRDNLQALALTARTQVLCRPVHAALAKLVEQKPFAWIFCDPPYALDELPRLASRLAALCDADSRLIIERATKHAQELAGDASLQAHFLLEDHRRYGDSTLLFFRPTFADKETP